ncbi:class I SAM-dependent methyltransferase [Millisia brevis]|uniref:class I SAM-dependent methyltransferase n=1 Tax=Millisia brevis TaxID=264148 RepID=UPI000A020328|nr:class I SAM-dependent methyltransferase [Millisia brevis]
MSPVHAPGMNPEQAREWFGRWEGQQRHYAQGRDERFEVICDAVEAVNPRPGVIVDLGSGPGSLAARVAARFPRCEVIAVDIDPFLIALGRAAHPGIGFVRADMATTDWTQHLRSTAVSAVVSSTALHYPTPSALADIYRTCAAVLSSGGVMVNADHLHPSAYLREVARLVGARSAHRRDTPPAAEDWEHWWAAANRVPEFAELLRDRKRLVPPHPGDNDLMVDDHRRLMCDNGFAVADTVWQCGFSTVLVGRKAP